MIWPGVDVSTEPEIPDGSVPRVRLSPACALSRTICAELISAVSASVIVTSVSAIATGTPFSVNEVAKLLPAALWSRSSAGAKLKCRMVVAWSGETVLRLLTAAPSFSCHSMVRVEFALLGSGLDEL